jgi:hypothetical protein
MLMYLDTLRWRTVCAGTTKLPLHMPGTVTLKARERLTLRSEKGLSLAFERILESVCSLVILSASAA